MNLMDRKIIYKFLDSNFKLSFFNSQLVTYDKLSNLVINEKKFIKLIYQIFDDYEISKNIRVIDIVVDWWKIEEDKILVNINDYLSKCDITNTSRQLVFRDSDGNLLPYNKIVNEISKLDNNLPVLFIHNFIDRWFNDKLFELNKEF